MAAEALEENCEKRFAMRALAQRLSAVGRKSGSLEWFLLQIVHGCRKVIETLRPQKKPIHRSRAVSGESHGWRECCVIVPDTEVFAAITAFFGEPPLVGQSL